MSSLKQRTPNPDNEYVLQFCGEVAPGSLPVILEVIPSSGSPAKECYVVVEQKVIEAGGESVLGWIILEIPGLMIEATTHAVWRDKEGILHDIAPQAIVFDQHLFLPDPSLRYEGSQLPNIRKALRDDPVVHRFIRSREMQFEVLNKGDRANQVGEISMDASEWRPVQRAMQEADLAIINFKFGRNEPCPCGSGRKYKKCCLRNL